MIHDHKDMISKLFFAALFLSLTSSAIADCWLKRPYYKHWSSIPPVSDRVLASCPSESEADQEYIRILRQYERERSGGAISSYTRETRTAYLQRLLENQPNNTRLKEQLLKLEQRPSFSGSTLKSLLVLAEERHALSLRSLGVVYEFGIGVEFNFSRAWAFHDAYNLVAGVDGVDQYREGVGERMNEGEILKAIGIAREYREMYTDAWKVPSLTIVNVKAKTEE